MARPYKQENIDKEAAFKAECRMIAERKPTLQRHLDAYLQRNKVKYDVSYIWYDGQGKCRANVDTRRVDGNGNMFWYTERYYVNYTWLNGMVDKFRLRKAV